MENETTRKYLLIGLLGHGKSIAGNVLINKSGHIDDLVNHPFKTNASIEHNIVKNYHHKTKDTSVINFLFFGDLKYEPQDVLNELRDALRLVENKINCLIFVIKRDRIHKSILEFFSTIQEYLFKNQFYKENSFLLITDAPNGWLQINKRFYDTIVTLCNGKYYELQLIFDGPYDDECIRKIRINDRQILINKFIDYLNKKQFNNQIDVSFIQTFDYECEWFETILSKLLQKTSITIGAELKNNCCVQ